MTKNKKHNNINTVANSITVLLLFCAIAFSVVLYVQNASIQNYIKDKVVEIEVAYEKIAGETESLPKTQLDKMQEKYFEYCNAVDQQYDNAFNKLLAFFSCIFSVTTIVNAYTAYRLPKIQEDQLKEIDSRMNDVERYVREADFYARIASLSAAEKRIKENIDQISEFINENRAPSYNLFFTRGSLYHNIKEYQKAESDYNKAKNHGMPLNMYHNAMGVLYSEMMRSISGADQKQKKEKFFKTAKDHYKKAIDLYKKADKTRKVSACLCNLACLYQDNGQYEKAMEYFEKAIDVDSSNAIAFLDRAISYEEMGQEHYEKALADYTMCLEIDPYYADARQSRAELAIKMYEIFGTNRYIAIAQEDCQKLSKESRRLKILEERINRNKTGTAHLDELVAKIDEKIADLSVEEALECEKGSEKYTKSMDDAKAHYISARSIYDGLYRKTSNNTYKEAVARIDCKLGNL